MSSDITPQISDKRRSFSPAFKMNIAKLALAGELSVSVIARQNDINTNQCLSLDSGISTPTGLLVETSASLAIIWLRTEIAAG